MFRSRTSAFASGVNRNTRSRRPLIYPFEDGFFCPSLNLPLSPLVFFLVETLYVYRLRSSLLFLLAPNRLSLSYWPLD